ncbi:MAG TPA: hypothetical protein VGN34_22640 [Ktedonobacteraceae bacterium]
MCTFHGPLLPLPVRRHFPARQSPLALEGTVALASQQRGRRDSGNTQQNTTRMSFPNRLPSTPAGHRSRVSRRRCPLTYRYLSAACNVTIAPAPSYTPDRFGRTSGPAFSHKPMALSFSYPPAGDPRWHPFLYHFPLLFVFPGILLFRTCCRFITFSFINNTQSACC